MPSEPSSVWFINGHLLILFVAFPAVTLLLRAANIRIFNSTYKEKPMPAALVVALTLISNLLGVASLSLLAASLSTPMRLSMLIVPALLLVVGYGAIMRRKPKKRRILAFELAGSLAGLFLGAALFMRHAAASEPIARVAVPADVHALPLGDVMQSQVTWAVSLKLGVFYIVSLAIFFSLHTLLKSSAKKLMDCPPKMRAWRTALATVLAFGLNFMGVAALIFMTQSSEVQARLAMVAFPLFLIVESYVKLLRAEPQNRPSLWSGLIGSSVGMVVASFFLLRGAPLH